MTEEMSGAKHEKEIVIAAYCVLNLVEKNSLIGKIVLLHHSCCDVGRG